MKLFNLSLKAILQLAVAFFIGAAAVYAFGYPDYAMTAGWSMVILSFIPKGKQMAGVLNTITAADVVTEFGAYYIDQGQGIADLQVKLMQKSVTAGYFPRRITANTVLRKASASFTSVLQSFQKAYTPIGGATFLPRQIPLQKLKIDLLETPDDFEESWLGFLEDNSLDRKAWPYIKWYLTQALMQADSDEEKLEIYTGTGPATIVPGTASTPGTNLYGIKKQINDFNTAESLNLITMGAVPTDPVDFLNYCETFIAEIDQVLRSELDFLFMSETLRNRFRQGMRAKYNTYYAQTDDLTKFADYDIKIVWLPSMAASTKIWTTPPWNRQGGMKKPGNEKIFQVENVDRQVKAYTDYYKGYGFWLAEYVCSQDVELT